MKSLSGNVILKICSPCCNPIAYITVHFKPPGSFLWAVQTPSLQDWTIVVFLALDVE